MKRCAGCNGTLARVHVPHAPFGVTWWQCTRLTVSSPFRGRAGCYSLAPTVAWWRRAADQLALPRVHRPGWWR